MNIRLTEKQLSWLAMGGLWCLLLVLCATRPLALPDEGRYAEIGRWMLLSGDWLAPRLDGMPFFHKPPLLHWMQAASLGLMGVHAWSARLVPALHAGLLLLATYLATRSVHGERLARHAVLILGSSLGFLIGGQYVNHDMLVACWISVAIWSFSSAFMRGHRPDAGLAMLGFAACGLGFLSKGLIGLVLPGLVLSVWLVWTRQLPKLLQLPWIRGVLILLGIGLPWFVAAQLRYPELFNYLIIGQHFSRYTGGSFNNQWPGWFYLVVAPMLVFPWSVLILRDLQPRRWQRAWREDHHSTGFQWTSLLWIWLLSIMFFFSLPKSKIVGYILPVLPPVACLAALAWQKWPGRGITKSWWFAGLLLASVGLSVTANWMAGRQTLRYSSQDVARVLGCAKAASDRVYVAGEYPYDLPFYARLTHPLLVAHDWTEARKNSGDGWRRELFEAADFDAEAAQSLVGLSALESPADGSWLVTPLNFSGPAWPSAWSMLYKGKAWALWRFDASALKGPAPAQDERLKRCQH